MTDLSRERCRALAEKNGWSLARAEGFLDGESFRRLALTPPKHAQVGIDEYCLGFRAGYYERKTRSVTQSSDSPTSQLKVRRNTGRS
jgi:hypothetical protein